MSIHDLSGAQDLGVDVAIETGGQIDIDNACREPDLGPVTVPAVTVADTMPPVKVNAVSLSVALIRMEPSTPDSFTGP